MKKKLLIIGFASFALLIFIILLLLLFSRQSNKPNISSILTPAPTNSSSFTMVTPQPGASDRSDAPADDWNRALEEYKTDEPDFFFMNYATHQSDTFSSRYIYKKTPTKHYAFIITLTGPDKDKAKLDAIGWIKSTGLTDAQINTLDIEYQ